MKKTFVIIALLLAFLAGSATMPSISFAVEQEEKNPIKELTGKLWLDTTQDCKEAFLYGIDSAIAVEKLIYDHFKKNSKGKKNTPKLSPFVAHWQKAFHNIPRENLVKDIDKWYTDNPDKINRPVLEVIWFEIIEPRVYPEKTTK